MTSDMNTELIPGYEIIFEQKISVDYIRNNFDEVIIAIGDNKTRLKLSLRYQQIGMKLATIIHQNASVSKLTMIEEGTVICANAVVGPFSKIGKACVISSCAMVAHDCDLDHGVRISPNAVMGGHCKIGKETWVCIGATLTNNINIGNNSVIAAGAVVLKDVQDNVLKDLFY